MYTVAGGTIYAFTPTGSLSWARSTGIQLTTPAVVAPDGKIIVGGRGGVFAYTSAGEAAWQFALPADHEAMVPAVDAAGVVVFGIRDRSGSFTGSRVVALLPPGQVLWDYPVRDVVTPPAIGPDGTVYIVAQDNSFQANLLAFGSTGIVGTITAHKFQDTNQNGVQDPGEPNLQGWTMSLYQGSGCSGAALRSGTTNTSGDVTFTGLAAGSYSVKETLQAGWVATTDVCVDVGVQSAESKTVSFGNLLGADLVVTKAASADSVAVGSNLTYSITVRNNGLAKAAGVTLTDTLDPNVTPVSFTPTQDCIGLSSISVMCVLGDLASGASATVTIVVKPTEEGLVTNKVTAQSLTPDPNIQNNKAVVFTTVIRLKVVVFLADIGTKLTLSDIARLDTALIQSSQIQSSAASKPLCSRRASSAAISCATPTRTAPFEQGAGTRIHISATTLALNP